jgi:site-specific recombinase XerD
MSTRGMKFPPEYLHKDEVAAILKACGPDDDIFAMRHRALIVLMWRSGLRLAEALALRPSDIDQQSLSVRVLHGKGNKARTTATDPQALDIINQWVQKREDVWGITHHFPGPIISTEDGNPLQQSYVRRKLPEIARNAGVQRRCHAHIFRHTFAVELSQSGVPVKDIQVLLGHTSLATTSVYLSSLSPEESLKHLRKREW